MPKLLDLDQLRAVAAALPDPVFILTESGLYGSMFGGTDARYYHDGSALIGKYLHEVLSPERTQWFIEKIHEALHTKQMVLVEYALSNKDVLGLPDVGPSEPIWFEGRVSALGIRFNDEAAVAWVATNISARKAMERKLFEQAHTDSLTGLNNRRRFMQSLEASFDIFVRYGQNTCVVTFDIDHFKGVNDVLGHPRGDAALQVVADILSSHCRKPDFCGRLGGDEFVVLCPHISMEEVFTFCERIRSACYEALESYSSSSKRVSLSIGATCFSRLDQSPDASVLRSDKGVYQSKSLGGNRTSLIQPPTESLTNSSS